MKKILLASMCLMSMAAFAVDAVGYSDYNTYIAKRNESIRIFRNNMAACIPYTSEEYNIVIIGKKGDECHIKRGEQDCYASTRTMKTYATTVSSPYRTYTRDPLEKYCKD